MVGALVTALHEQHAALMLICDRLEAAVSKDEKAALLGVFAKALIAHLCGLEVVLLPATVENEPLSDDVSRGLKDSASDLRSLLADALASPVDNEAFLEAIESTCTLFHQCMAAEIAFLRPRLSLFSESEQMLLAADLELEAERFSTEFSGAPKAWGRE